MADNNDEAVVKPRPCARCGSTNTNADRWTTTPYSFKPAEGHLQFLCPECWKIEEAAYEAFCECGGSSH
jgi:hypothetical protein